MIVGSLCWWQARCHVLAREVLPFTFPLNLASRNLATTFGNRYSLGHAFCTWTASWRCLRDLRILQCRLIPPTPITLEASPGKLERPFLGTESLTQGTLNYRDQMP